MPKLTRKSGPHSQDTCPLTLYWMFKLILDCGGHRELISHGCFSDDDIARELGVYWLGEDNLDDDNGDEDFFEPACKSSFRKQALRALQQERALFNETFPSPDLPDNLSQNLENLAQLMGLDKVEQALIGFCSLMNTDPLLDDCCNTLGHLGFNRLIRVLGELLDVAHQELRMRLSAEGRLVQSGLLVTNRPFGARHALSDLLCFTNKDLLFSLRHHKGAGIKLFQNAFRPAPEGLLDARDFAHLDTSLDIVRSYLQQVLKEKKPGVNILLYGPPGTGKSQLTRLLAKELHAQLYEIACTDSEGDPITRHGRMCALRSAMYVLGQQQSLLVLDEIEDLFGDEHTFAQMLTGQERQKGWINRMLEENPIPCFWLTNNINALDNAYIRRFDLVLKLENPPRRQREAIIRNASGGRLRQPLIDKLADHDHLMPAIVTRAVSVAKSRSQAPSPDLESTVELLVNATLQAQGFARLGQDRMQALPEFYRPGLANTDIPLDQLLKGLREHDDARLCFYGPPGTGKTAFGHWLANQLDKPLLSRRASDLISPYVGMTADSTPFGHSAHADPDTCSTIIRTGSRSAATQGLHC